MGVLSALHISDLQHTLEQWNTVWSVFLASLMLMYMFMLCGMDYILSYMHVELEHQGVVYILEHAAGFHTEGESPWDFPLH